MTGHRRSSWDRLLLGPYRRRRRLSRLLRGLDGGSPVEDPHPHRRQRRSAAAHTVLVALITTVVFCVLASTVLSNSVSSLLGVRFGASRAFAGDGTYRFLRMQPGSSTEPVAYDRCRTIHVVLNPDEGPRDAEPLLRSVLAQVSKVSGLRLRFDGLSDRRPDWSGGSLAGLSRRPPVLVAFATADEVSDLRGKVAGVGGSTSVEAGRGGLRHYVTGQVTLDSDSFRRLERRFDGRLQERAIMLHEFGHVLGLAHVKDPHELMYEHNLGLTSYGPGDVKGLQALGRGRCF